MKIEGNHWTVRWYRRYVELGGFGRDPENLCRFLRVVTIWAPLRWLFVPRNSKDQARAGDGGCYMEDRPNRTKL